MIFNYTQQTSRKKKTSRHLVGDGVGPRSGAGDVVEPVGDSSILHDVAGMQDVWACGRHLNLNLIADTSGMGAQAHPGQQVREMRGGLAARWKR